MIKTGKMAPQFNLPSSSGATVNLQKLLEKNAPLMVIFYKNNCPTCQYTFPYLTKIAKTLGPEHFLAIAQDSVSDAKAFRQTYGFNFEVLSDVRPYPVSVSYGIEFVPTIFIIEDDGSISKIAEGFDKKAIEDFANRVASLQKLSHFSAFDPAENVPLLKPG